MGDRYLYLLIAIAGMVAATFWLFDGFLFADEGRRDSRGAPHVSWRLGGEGRGTPVVVDNTTYFLSKRHEVLAIDNSTGLLKWTRHTGEPGDETAGTAMVSAGSLVIAGDYDVVAFDRDGRYRWRFAPADGYGTGIYLGETIESTVFAGSPVGRLYAINAETGTARWSAVVSSADQTTVFAPVVSGDLVVVGYTTFATRPVGGMVGYDVHTGQERWRTPFPSSSVGAGLTGGPAVVADVVAATNRDGTILVMDRADGRILRQIGPTGDRMPGTAPGAGQDFRALAGTGRTLVAGSLTGTVVAYDVDRGTQRWRRTPVETSAAFAIACDDHAAYVPYLSGQLVALDIRTGEERWRIGGSADGFNWMPRLSGEQVYVSASRAGFFALTREVETR